jgi:hypothetical protein
MNSPSVLAPLDWLRLAQIAPRLWRARADPNRRPSLFALDPLLEFANLWAADYSNLESPSRKIGVVLGLHFHIVPDEAQRFAGLVIRVFCVAVEGDKHRPVQPSCWQGRSKRAVISIVRQDLKCGTRRRRTLIAFIGTPMNPRFLPQNESSRERYVWKFALSRDEIPQKLPRFIRL